MEEMPVKTIAQLSDEIHMNAIQKKFWEDGFDLPKALMLAVGELSEALEADRIDKHSDLDTFDWVMGDETENNKLFVQTFDHHIKGGIGEELADNVMRVFDMCVWLNIDLQRLIELKIRYNKLRPVKHGKKY